MDELKILYHSEDENVTLEDKKNVIAVFRTNGFLKDIDKKRLKGRMFQISLILEEDNSKIIDLTVPVNFEKKEDLKFLKGFFNSQEEPSDSDFEKVYGMCHNLIKNEYEDLISNIKIPKKDKEVILEIIDKSKEIIDKAKNAYVIDVRTHLYPTNVSLKAVIIED